MRKNLLTAGLIVVLLAMTAIPAIAQDGDPEKGPKAPPRTRPHGQSNVGHLLLVGKNATWDPIWPEAFGVLKYNRWGPTFNFKFNGHKLMPEQYSLIYYVDPGPGKWKVLPEIVILATGTPIDGNLHLTGSKDIGSIPYEDDVNYDDEGAKIWLVLTADLLPDADPSTFDWAWNPDKYLFESDLIKYDIEPPLIEQQ